ncbi:30S ribosomal protein S4 [Candidatus Wolfebacteria bacterium RIFCSPLOWO2_01_FULL_38_11]|uniref:Small ribosomal subunit protein uS4 n=1 Tax=Candidatus Wolfebacteria bacterium RIFCSPLOWO2_01_FULL_38_11 TaxID=1802556 RepID=A0A1F8DU46_9BACT|nr:MAG: 30S ribosomal protein S4 [Candidatus Wolfebacteria bacterium RIFCSPLOWO2_01_FULL_38_11]
MIRPKEKKERALGIKLFLKGDRCNSPKCAMTRKPYKPGIHGKSRRRGALSEYGQQLLEKQKIKASYGLTEAQLRNLFENASGPKESSMNKSVVNLLERRLDNVVFRLSFAPSRIAARQRVSHGHFLVNDKRASTPSYILKAGDVISLNPASRELLIFKDLPNIIKKYEPPQWLSLDKDKLEGKVKSLSFEVEAPFDVNLVVDYYSR